MRTGMDKLGNAVPHVLSITPKSRSLSLKTPPEQRARDLRWAKLLLGQYRKGEIDDPEVFIETWARIFHGYDDEVVGWVVDPLTGIGGKINWPPTAAEVKRA